MNRSTVFLLSLAVLGVWAPAATADVLLVGNKSDDTLSFVDLASGAVVATVPTGGAPHEIAVSPDGRTAAVTNYGTREEPGHTLTIVDVPAASVLRTIDLGEHQRPHGVLFWGGDRRLVVTAEESKALLVVDVAEGRVEKVIDTGQEVSHMVALAGDRAYVANIGSGSITAIDLAAGESLGSVPTGEGAEGIAITPDGAQIWVTNRAAGTISLVDPESLAVASTLESPGFPIRAEVTPDGGRVLVTNAADAALTVIDTSTRKVAERVSIQIEPADLEDRLFGDRFGDSSVPIGIEIAPDGGRAYIAHANADKIQVLDLQSFETVRLLVAGREPDGMAYSTASVSGEGSP